MIEINVSNNYSSTIELNNELINKGSIRANEFFMTAEFATTYEELTRYVCTFNFRRKDNVEINGLVATPVKRNSKWGWFYNISSKDITALDGDLHLTIKLNNLNNEEVITTTSFTLHVERNEIGEEIVLINDSQYNALLDKFNQYYTKDAIDNLVFDDFDIAITDKEVNIHFKDGSPKGVYANLSALQTAYPSGASGVYLTSDNGHWYWWNGSAWTDGGVYHSSEDVKQIKEDVNQIKEDLDNKVNGIKLKNLFNKKTAIDGYFVSPSSGILIENENFCASDFIPIEVGKTYSCTLLSNCAFYKKDKTYLKSAGSDNPFTVPNDVAYIRCSVAKANVNTFMFNEGNKLLPYENYGTVLTIDSFNDDVISELKNKMGIKENTVDYSYLNHIREHLNNPFIKTQIKLVGDSITHGMGGTGFNANGETIGGSTTKANDLNATCWANMLYHYIESVYNKEFEVDVDNDNINKPSTSSAIVRGETIINGVNMGYTQLIENNTTVGRSFMSFNFYGDSFSIFNKKSKANGIYEIYVDEELKATVDCYSDTDDVRAETYISGLSVSNHTVVLKCKAERNSESTLNQVIITGISVKKIAKVVPWGISGSTSSSAINTNGRYSIDDDFVILMYGTNDRHIFFTNGFTYKNLVEACNLIKDTYKAEPILMCAPPTNTHYESNEDVTRFYHMWDVHDAIAKAGEHFGVPFIDNYTAFMDYAEQHNITTDDLLADGLHPNDLGHKVLFENVMRNLGLARLPYYREWNGN